MIAVESILQIECLEGFCVGYRHVRFPGVVFVGVVCPVNQIEVIAIVHFLPPS